MNAPYTEKVEKEEPAARCAHLHFLFFECMHACSDACMHVCAVRVVCWKILLHNVVYACVVDDRRTLATAVHPQKLALTQTGSQVPPRRSLRVSHSIYARHSENTAQQERPET